MAAEEIDYEAVLEDAWDSIAEDTEIKRLIPLQSSNLAAAGYSRTDAQLAVAFLDGSVYLYYDVEWGVYMRLTRAESHGEYFYHNIRLSYVYEKLA